MPVQQLFSFSDLPAVKSSPESVKSAFKKHFKKDPDGISVNSETYFGAVKPAITEQYGHPCFKRLGEFSFKEAPIQPPSEAVVGSNYAVNESDEEATITVTVEGAWSEQTGWNSSVTTGLTISEEFTIEGVFKLGTEFSISTTVGKSGSKSESRKASSTVTATVPPRSKKKIEMVATLQEESMDFTAPIAVQGMFGANFPSQVQGHYFWFLSAREVLAATSGEIKGTIKHTAALHVQTNVGKVESIK